MHWQKIVTDYLTFTRKERIGVLLVLALIFFVFFLPKITGNKPGNEVNIDTAWISSIKKLETKKDNTPSNLVGSDENFAYQYDRKLNNPSRGELFYFNPNTASANEWRKLGLRERTITTILNFREKGGRFYKPEDLRKIYGLQIHEYERLLPYIRIEATASPKNDSFMPAQTVFEKKPASRYSVIEINTADTTQFISLPGIGSKLAARIVNFREKLGGFYSIGQVGETYGLPDSTFQKIKQYLILESTALRKVNINKATAEELYAHPYISANLARAIAAYRTEHGPFSNLEEIKKIMLMTDDIYNKLAPYLELQE
jgi:competence protein ComEA